MMKDRNLTAEVAKPERLQKCEACNRVRKQSDIRPVYLCNQFRTMHVCRDCEKSLN